MSEPEKKKKGCGCCLGKGCLILVILIGAFIGFCVWGYRWSAIKARHYTTASAEAIPVETINEGEYNALVSKMDAFKNAASGSNATLSLTAHDLNVLIALSPEWKLVRGKIYTRIDEGDVSLMGSIPLTSIPQLRDQYVNGTLLFTPSIENKVLHVTVKDIKLKTNELPKAYTQGIIAGIEPQLTNRLLGDPVIGKVLIKAETMKVESGALLLTRAAD